MARRKKPSGRRNKGPFDFRHLDRAVGLDGWSRVSGKTTHPAYKHSVKSGKVNLDENTHVQRPDGFSLVATVSTETPTALAWTQPICLTTWLIPVDDGWRALAEQFDVIGAGPTQHAAIDAMDELLLDYFSLIADDGGTPEDARRPISLTRKLRLEFERAFGVVKSQLRTDRHVYRLPHEAQAHC